MLALQLEPLYAAEAKRVHDANGGDHGNQHTGGKVAASQKSDAPPKIRTDEQLAKLAGTSRDTIRKSFTKSERVDYIKRLLRIEQAKAKERQTSGTSVENSTEVGRSDEITAAAFGMKKDTMRRELFIANNADLLDPADFANWDEGKLSTNKAYQRIGEILRELPTRQGARTDTTSCTPMQEVTKAQAIENSGISSRQAYDLQAMAANPDVVQAIHLDADSMHGAGSMRSRSGPETPHPSPSVCMTPRGADHSLQAAQMPPRAAQAPTDAPDGYVVGSCPCR